MFLSDQKDVDNLIRVWLTGLRHQEAMESEIVPVSAEQAVSEGKQYCRIEFSEPEWAEFLFRENHKIRIPVTKEGKFFLQYLQKKEKSAKRHFLGFTPEPYLIFPVVFFKNRRGYQRIAGLLKIDCPGFSYPSEFETQNATEEEVKKLFFELECDKNEDVNFWLDAVVLEEILNLHEDKISQLRTIIEKSGKPQDLLQNIFLILFDKEMKQVFSNRKILEEFVCELTREVAEVTGAGAKVYPHALLCHFDRAFITRQLQRDLEGIVNDDLLKKADSNSPCHIFLRGGDFVERESENSFSAWIGQTLSASQQNAYRFSRTHQVAVIEGPPGSGKTHLIRHLLTDQIISHALNMNLRKIDSLVNFRTLLTGVNNQAVDQAMTGLGFDDHLPVSVRLGSYSKFKEVTVPFLKEYYRNLSEKDPEKAKKSFAENQKLLKISLEDSEIRNESFALAICVIRAWAISHQEEIMELLLEIITDIEDKKGLKSFFKRKKFELFFHIFPVVGSTLLSVRNFFGMTSGLIDTIILDEAGQCPPAYILPALFRSKNAVFLGDTKQLQPISKFSVKDWKSILKHRDMKPDYEDLKEYLPTLENPSSVQQIMENAAGDKLISLKEHYRCSPQIARLMVDLSGYDLSIQTSPPPYDDTLKAQDLWYIDHEEKEEEFFGSWSNRKEEELIGHLVKNLLQKGFSPGDIAIITPYRGQFFRLLNLFRRTKIFASSGEKENNSDRELILGTVHRFQGGERKVVIFSHVNSYREPLFINTSLNLLNVAVSRAKQRFFFVGNLSNLQRGKYTSVLYKHLMEFGQVYRLNIPETPKVFDSYSPPFP